jgi:hypothetical protein
MVSSIVVMQSRGSKSDKHRRAKMMEIDGLRGNIHIPSELFK